MGGRAWQKQYPRWVLKGMNENLFKVALAFMTGAFPEDVVDVDDLAKWIQEAVTNAYDMSSQR